MITRHISEATEHATRSQQSDIASRTRRLVRDTTGLLLLGRQAIITPSEELTREQAEGIIGLEPFIPPLRMRTLFRKIQDIKDNRDAFEPGDPVAWSEVLRTEHLKWFTREERLRMEGGS